MANWSPEQHKELINNLNNELLADPATAGKVFIIDPTGGMTTEKLFENLNEIIGNGKEHNSYLENPEAAYHVRNMIRSATPGTNMKNGLNLDDENYLGMSVAAEAGETVKLLKEGSRVYEYFQKQMA
jgi:hypothetical protein